MATETRVQEEPFLTCPDTSNHSEPFAKEFCQQATEEGVFESQEECMRTEGQKLANLLDSEPLQERFLHTENRVSAATEVSEPSFLGTTKGFDRQFRYPDWRGDIHIRTTQDGDLGAVHRDKCPPGEAPVRHVLGDYLLPKEEN